MVHEVTTSLYKGLSNILLGEHHHGWGKRNPKKRKRAAAESDSEDGDDEDEMPGAKFRRGEPLPSDIEFGDDDSCGSDDPPDEIDDGEWNMMGAALEREFLSGSDDWTAVAHHRCVVTPKFCVHVLLVSGLEFL